MVVYMLTNYSRQPSEQYCKWAVIEVHDVVSDSTSSAAAGRLMPQMHSRMNNKTTVVVSIVRFLIIRTFCVEYISDGYSLYDM